MVYRGLPSKACLPCRKRKLRCDLRQGRCGQCARAHLDCSGYRDSEQLRIKDQSQVTKEKALAGKVKLPPRNLTVSLEDRARNAFFCNYVSGFSKTYDVLEPLYHASSSRDHLSSSVDAVSLAFFSSQYDSIKALHKARERYMDALPVLNRALQSSQYAKSDSTLLAVLLLDLFEKITSNDPRSTNSWMSHVNGALALVKLRGHDHLADYAGRRLSHRLSTNLLISVIAANEPVPFGLIKLRSDLGPLVNGNDPKWQLSGLCLKYANLQSVIKEGRLASDSIITRARELDQEFVSLAEGMPATWLYSTTNLDAPTGAALDQHFDVYPDHFITQTWNVLRAMRIFLQNIIEQCYLEIESCDTNPIRKSEIARETIDCMSREICATVPQYTTLRAHVIREKKMPEFQRLECYTLLFPLYVAGMYASTMSSIRPFAIRQLLYMASELGVRNAATIAAMLKQNSGTSPWDAYAILGSYAFAT